VPTSSRCQGWSRGYDLGHRLRGPVEWVRVLIPFLDALFDLGTQVICGVNIHDTQALALKDAAPLFDLMHPRTMPRCTVHDNARMVGEPFSERLSENKI
jgi:hypothetical protein